MATRSASAFVLRQMAHYPVAVAALHSAIAAAPNTLLGRFDLTDALHNLHNDMQRMCAAYGVPFIRA